MRCHAAAAAFAVCLPQAAALVPGVGRLLRWRMPGGGGERMGWLGWMSVGTGDGGVGSERRMKRKVQPAVGLTKGQWAAGVTCTACMHARYICMPVRDLQYAAARKANRQANRQATSYNELLPLRVIASPIPLHPAAHLSHTCIPIPILPRSFRALGPPAGVCAAPAAAAATVTTPAVLPCTVELHVFWDGGQLF